MSVSLFLFCKYVHLCHFFRQINKENVVYTHNGILLSHKKEWNIAICSNVDGPGDDHTMGSQKEKDKYHMIPLTWVCYFMDMYFHFSWVNILHVEFLGHGISVCLTIKTFSNCFPNWLYHFPRTAATCAFFSFVCVAGTSLPTSPAACGFVSWCLPGVLHSPFTWDSRCWVSFRRPSAMCVCSFVNGL